MDGAVIVLDDEKSFADLVALILRDAGVHVWAFSDPRSALRAIRAKDMAVNVVLVDQKMPHYSGSSFFRALRTRNPEILGILVTGYADLETYFGSRTLFFDFVSKPFANADLLFRVFRALYVYRLHKEGVMPWVLSLEHRPSIATAARMDALRTEMRHCDSVVLSGGKATDSSPHLPQWGKGTRVAFCHEGFLSEPDRRKLKDLLEEKAPQVARIPWQCWRDVRDVPLRRGDGP